MLPRRKDGAVDLLLALGNNEDGPLSDVLGLALMAPPPPPPEAAARVAAASVVKAETSRGGKKEKVVKRSHGHQSEEIERALCQEEAQAALGQLSDAGVIR